MKVYIVFKKLDWAEGFDLESAKVFVDRQKAVDYMATLDITGEDDDGNGIEDTTMYEYEVIE